MSVKRNDLSTQQHTASAMKTGQAKEQKHKGQKALQGKQASARWCDKCGLGGHTTERCWVLHPELRPNDFDPSKLKGKEKALEKGAVSEATAQFSSLQFDQLPQSVKNQFNQGSAFSAAHTPLGSLRNASDSPATGLYDWLIDSGATHSMTPFRQNFVTYTVADMAVRVANGETTSAEGYGDVLIELKQDGEPTTLLAKNVWFVPRLDTNLLSVAELGEDQVTVYFNAPRLPSLVFKDNSYLGLIRAVDRKYWLSTIGLEPKSFRSTLIQNNMATALATSGRKQQLSMRTWHRRLGHLGPQNLVHLKQVSTGMDFDDHFSAHCPDCILANSTAKPHGGATSSLIGKPYELVHIDLWGPAPVESQQGNRFVLTILDDFTKTLRMTCLKSKADSKDVFKAFEAEVSTQFGYTVKAVRWDNGGEFTDHSLHAYLRSKGMFSHPSTPYSPQQNGAAERAHRTIASKVRAMLAESHLPNTLWDRLFIMAVYLHHRSPSKALGGITPYERLRGSPPDLSHLRVPGCRAWVFIPKEKRANKLAKRAEECRFIGYDFSTKIYLLYGVQSHNIIRTSDVIFDEGPLLWQLNGNGDQKLSTIDFPVDDENEHEFPGTADSTVYHQQELEEPDDGAANNTSATATAFLSSIASASSISSPTYKQAMAGPEKDQWLKAMAEEYDAIVANHTWELVDYKPGLNVLPGKWVLKIKNNGRYKARYVCGGYK
jgi:transposase InsO family protein